MVSFNDFDLTGRLREDAKIREEAELENEVRILRKENFTSNEISRYLEIYSNRCLEVAKEVEEMVFYKN